MRTHTQNLLISVALLLAVAGCPSGPAPVGEDAGTDTFDSGAVGQDAGGAPNDGGTFACSPGVALQPTDVRIESGVIRGSLTNGMRAFKGVPYVKAPVDALRWALPQPLGCFDTPILDATAYGNVCPQYQEDGGIAGNEDCLTLQVWSPVGASNRPVLFFIHGGGHEAGSASKPLYDAAALAKSHGNVVVTINYRLGPFGFMAHPALTAEGGQSKSGNYGMHDQLAALKWVKENIAAFGGDPSKVLLFGESAGAVSVCRIVASPLAANLYSSAIMESGACTARAAADAEARGTEIGDRAGCPLDGGLSTACLRSKTTAQMMAGFDPVTNISSEIGNLNFDGVIDGYAVPLIPFQQIATGNFNKVPMIITSNANELSRGVPNIATEAAFRVAVKTFMGTKWSQDKEDQVVTAYPASAYDNSWKKAYVQVISEATFICSGRRDGLNLAEHSGQPTYRAIFADVPDNAPALLSDLGAFHGAELLWVFDAFAASEVYSMFIGDNDRKTRDDMQSAWNMFASTGAPTGPNVPAWPTYASATNQVMVFKDGSTVATDPYVDHCALWQTLASQ